MPEQLDLFGGGKKIPKKEEMVSREGDKNKEVIEKILADYSRIKAEGKTWPHGRIIGAIHNSLKYTSEQVDDAMNVRLMKLKKKKEAEKKRAVIKKRKGTAPSTATWIDGYYGNKNDNR